MVGIPYNGSKYGWFGELSIAENLNKHGMITCLTKTA